MPMHGERSFRYQRKFRTAFRQIDIQIEVPRIKIEELRKEAPSRDNNINKIKDLVLKAREIQKTVLRKPGQNLFELEMSSKWLMR